MEILRPGRAKFGKRSKLMVRDGRVEEGMGRQCHQTAVVEREKLGAWTCGPAATVIKGLAGWGLDSGQCVWRRAALSLAARR